MGIADANGTEITQALGAILVSFFRGNIRAKAGDARSRSKSSWQVRPFTFFCPLGEGLILDT
jgi:hypothetical protein